MAVADLRIFIARRKPANGLGVERHLCACGAEKLATSRGSRDFQAFRPDRKPSSLWIAVSETCRSLTGAGGKGAIGRREQSDNQFAQGRGRSIARSLSPCLEYVMTLPRRRFLHLAAGAAALPALSRFAWGQAYPTRPITIVVPFPAGGALDVFGRILAERMRASLAQNVIIENIAGASGGLGTGRVARAAPDGYTLVIGYWGTHVANGVVYALPYDVLRDFEPIALTVTSPILIVSKNVAPAKSLQELIEWLKANPDKASAGTAGMGDISHIGSVLFQNLTGTRFQFVPYRGAAPAVQDLVAGQIDLMFLNLNTSLPQIRDGKIKAFAVAAKTRSATALEIPTTDEAGLPGFYVTLWLGVWAPKSTPRNVIAKLNSATVTALADPMVRTRLAELGFEIFPRDQQTPEALAAYQKAEIDEWWPIIKAAGIKAE